MDVSLGFFAQAGALGVYAWVLYKLHRSAVIAHEKRADDWKAAHDAVLARSDVRDAQVTHILAALGQKKGETT